MTDRQRWNPEHVRETLHAYGYDVDPTGTGSGDTSISARQERAGQARLFAIDSGGRFRVEVTAAGAESRRTGSFGPVPVVIVAQTQRLVTVTGALPDWEALPAVLDRLATLR